MAENILISGGDRFDKQVARGWKKQISYEMCTFSLLESRIIF